MKWGTRAAEVRPLRARFKMVDGFRRFNLDRSHEFSGTIRRGQDEVGKNLELADFDRRALILPDVRHDVMATLQLDLKEPYDAIVFELFANGADEDRTHLTSGRWPTAGAIV